MAVTGRLAPRTFDRTNIASQDDPGMAARKTKCTWIRYRRSEPLNNFENRGREADVLP
jgi:hypothetical protein